MMNHNAAQLFEDNHVKLTVTKRTACRANAMLEGGFHCYIRKYHWDVHLVM
jgi:hypothetical protein